MPPVAVVQGIEIHWDEIAAFLQRRVDDPAVAADLTQETYLRAAALPGNTVLINPRAWLFATARNILIDHCRRNGVRRMAADGEETLAGLPDSQPSAEARLIAREELDVLTRAVEGLPPRTREVFRLHKYESKSYAEIADLLGIAKNTVMVHMVKALGLCRQAMQKHRESEDGTNGSGPVMRLPAHDR